MNRPRLLGYAAFLGASTTASIMLAQQSYDAPIIGVTATEGRRWGWGAVSPTTIVSAGAFEGWRFERYRVGLLQQVNSWQGGHGLALDLGGFLSVDMVSFWLDPEISGALFFRWEPAARVKLTSPLWAMAPSVVFGVRAAGVEIGVSVTEEVWLSSLPNDAGPAGANLQAKLGLEIFELVHLVEHINASKESPTP
jgi:hypothetical protein